MKFRGWLVKYCGRVHVKIQVGRASTIRVAKGGEKSPGFEMGGGEEGEKGPWEGSNSWQCRKGKPEEGKLTYNQSPTNPIIN